MPVIAAVPLPSVGRAIVPVGGLIPKTLSKVVPAVGCPISFSPELSVNAPV